MKFSVATISAILSFVASSYGAPTALVSNDFGNVVVLNSTELAAPESATPKRFIVANIAVYRPYSCSATEPVIMSVDSGRINSPFNIDFESGAAAVESLAPGCRAIGCFTNQPCIGVAASELPLNVCVLAKNGQRSLSWDKFIVICK